MGISAGQHRGAASRGSSVGQHVSGSFAQLASAVQQGNPSEANITVLAASTAMAVLLLALCEHVLEAPDLVQAAHVKAVRRRAQPHAAVEGSLEH